MSGDQTPLMFYLVGLSYLDAADHLTLSLHGPPYHFRLSFDEPVRHLYAHAIELFQKACLFEQGMIPEEMKHRFGHRLIEAWNRIDRARFSELKLDDEFHDIVRWLDVFHPTKEYAYPHTGYKVELSLEQLRDGMARFRIGRDAQLRLFSHS